jgi:hypothetical protein
VNLRATAVIIIPAIALAAGLAQAGAPVPKCSATKWKSALVARHGDFKIEQGLETIERMGYLGRQEVKTKGCALEAKAGDTFLLTFDAKIAAGLRNSSNFEMQCVDAVKPNGKMLSYDQYPSVGEADGKSWTPPCDAKDLSAAEKKVCSKGISNSERWDHWKALQEKAKTYSIDVSVRDDVASLYSRADQDPIDVVAPSGKVFCQYWDKTTKTALFTLTFDVPPKDSK